MPDFFLLLTFQADTAETLTDTRRNFTDGTQKQSQTGNILQPQMQAFQCGWTIFNGFNVQTTYKKLNELKQIGELNTQLSVENLVSDIISAYYNYIEQTDALKESSVCRYSFKRTSQD